MTTDPFDDELLSTVLDGLADDETVAAVQQNPAALERLDHLRAASKLVATPPPRASVERRASSIAAALAAAKSTPEVSSLAVAREERRRRIPAQWLAVAAAFVLLLVAVPLLANIGGEDAATTTAAEVEETSADDGRSLEADADRDTAATTAAAAADSALGLAEASSEDLADEQSEDGAAVVESFSAPTTTIFSRATVDRAPLSVGSLLQLERMIEIDVVKPQYAITDPVLQEAVNPACLEPFADVVGEAFDLVELSPTGEPFQLLLVVFHDGGSFTALDSQDCSTIS